MLLFTSLSLILFGFDTEAVLIYTWSEPLNLVCIKQRDVLRALQSDSLVAIGS